MKVYTEPEVRAILAQIILLASMSDNKAILKAAAEKELNRFGTEVKQ